MQLANRLVTLFPLWALLGTLAALQWPSLLSPLGPAIVPLLGVVMFGMGLTLTARDFLEVAQRPWLIAFGAALQFGIMPLGGWLVGHTLRLPPDLLAGVILVGSCPGGTASNVITYLARGDVPLSITLTTVSTLLAVALTPALTWLYAGQTVPVPVAPMLLSILNVVVLPVAGGVVLNRLWGNRLRKLQDFFPLLSVLAIVVIIAIVVALNAGRMTALAGPVALAVVLHNGLGLAGGYALPKLLGYEPRICRTISIEVGMQNSGLGVALATQFFSATAALPAAFFSVWHNLSGALLAGYWSRQQKAIRHKKN
ncbi:MAG TPA: bile acid:sodium symporter family protein [Terriglobia bacterium]|nr:bile acid:sodium symporter family protein [Terriglobia bacterium]